jgi:CRISPR system Cascade subunit CasE
MYFTRFPINLTRRESRRFLGSPYIFHAAIAGSFPPGGNSEEGRVLWRVDTVDNGGMYLYIVSPTKPSLVGLNEQIGWPDMPNQWETKSYDTFLKEIHDGQLYAFRLVANPVLNSVNVRDKHNKTKRIGHLTVLQQATWLVGADAYADLPVSQTSSSTNRRQSRAARNGFKVIANPKTDIPELVVSHSKKSIIQKRNAADPITLVTAQYDGIMQVVDANALRRALTFGIGHAKGFGCGLLTIVPLAKHEQSSRF